MTILQALVLGAVQGITEFLPVSSSGHLILIPEILGWQLQPLWFDVILHLGTTCAVLLAFMPEWVQIAKSLYLDAISITKSQKLEPNKLRHASRFFINMIAAIIPVAIAGIFLEQYIENLFRSPSLVALMLLAVTVLMILAELAFGRIRKLQIENYTHTPFKKILLVSLSQIIALFPGASRSGITITTGIFSGLNREVAAKISFMLATPIILGAGLLEIPELLASSVEIKSVIAGFLSSFIIGFLVIRWFIKYLKTKSLTIFIVYRVVLAVFILFYFYI